MVILICQYLRFDEEDFGGKARICDVHSLERSGSPLPCGENNEVTRNYAYVTPMTN